MQSRAIAALNIKAPARRIRIEFLHQHSALVLQARRIFFAPADDDRTSDGYRSRARNIHWIRHTSAGMIMHFLLGTIGFAVGFLIVGPYLPGPIWLRGVIFMAGVWFLAGLIAMPILGVGLFFGGAREAMAALIGHVAFGAILGAIARLPSRHVQAWSLR